MKPSDPHLTPVDLLARAFAFIATDDGERGLRRVLARKMAWTNSAEPQQRRWQMTAETEWERLQRMRTDNFLQCAPDATRLLMDAICLRFGIDTHAVAFRKLGINPDTGRRWLASGTPRWPEFILLRNALIQAELP